MLTCFPNQALVKKLTLLFLVFSCSIAHAQTVLWSEDFTGEADGAPTGTATGGTWNVTTSPLGTFSKQTRIGQPIFQANDTGGEGVFETSVIDISGTGMATVSVLFRTSFSSSTDYLRAYYRVDGGPEVLFSEFLGQLIDITVTGSAIVAGNSVQVIIRGSENTAGNIPIIGIPIVMGFDDLTVTSVPVLYSCNNSNTVFTGNWNVAATWSTAGFTGPCDAVTPPTVGQVAIIGGGVTVNLTADANVGGVDVRNTGTLEYTLDFLDIGIEMGFFRVQSGGVVNGDDEVAGQIDFRQNVGGATFQVDAGGSVEIDDLTLTNNASSLHYLQGDGLLTVVGQFIIDADDATLINNRTVPTISSGHLRFTGTTTGAEFINNGTLIAPALEFSGDNNFFTNNSVASFAAYIVASNDNADNNTITNSSGATLNFGTLDADYSAASTDGGNLTILNSGTINQTGTFLNIANNATALNDINNLAGGVWNYEGTGHDTDIRLFANNGTNDFNYSGSGFQQIISTVAGNGYSNLNLQNSGIKTAGGNFSVYGNWARTGTATFVPGAFTVTFSGSVAQTISAVGGETFSGLTFNNAFATSPQITLSNPVSVTGVLTMTDGNVNLNGNNFTLSSTAAGALVHGLTSASGWMYGGSIIRNRPASTAIGVGTAYSLFPLGSAGDWRPFFAGQISDANSAGTMTVSHTNLATTSAVTFPESITRRHDAFWTVSSTGITTGPTFDLQAGGTTFGTIEAGAAGLADLRMSTSTGVVGTHGAATGGPDYRVNRTAVTFASLANNYHVASTDAVNSPLPVELVSFTGEVVENGVQLTWETASELNNDFFTVERSETGEVFSGVGKVKGAGTTNQENTYSLIDYNPMYGTAYYRLKQTDFDGTFTYSKIISITYEGPTVAVLDVYPNPTTGDQFTIKISGLKNVESVPVVLYDQVGRECMKLILHVDKSSGTAYQIFSPETVLPQGMYFLKAGPSLLMQKRFIVVSK